MVKRVLMIAYHFPPLRGSSGIQRTLKFSQYLPESGWLPTVLSADPRAYASTSSDQVGEISKQISVHRAFALDTCRHLSLKGRYLRLLALPDRWVSWWLGAVPLGWRLIRQYRPDVIWSTYPIATAHLIGLTLHRLTGIPWVADLRDPMTDEHYPEHSLVRRVYRWIEEKTITHCTRAVLTTPGTVKLYRERYPHISASRFCLIENGYDEENFAEAEACAATTAREHRPFTIIHSGVIYPSERDPTQLFEALSRLAREKRIAPADFRLILRATGHDDYLRQLIAQHGISDLVTLAPPISYREALTEMLCADGLLVLQASNCNNQIPAKLYEYLRARRPLLALTDPAGDTAATLRSAGIDAIARLDSVDEIMNELQRFLTSSRNGYGPLASMQTVQSNSRQSRTRALAALFDEISQNRTVHAEEFTQ